MFHASFEPRLTNVKLYWASGTEEIAKERGREYYKVVGVPTYIVMKTYIAERGLVSNQVIHFVPEKHARVRLDIDGQIFFAKIMPLSTPSDERIIQYVRDCWLKELVGF